MKELKDWEEVFCIAYSKHGNATQAYHKAKPLTTYDTCRTSGSLTYAKLHIKERIQFLIDEFAANVHQSKESTINDLIRSAEEAKAAGQFSAYAKIRDMIIKMCGFYAPEKVEVESKTYTIGFGE